MHASLYYEYGMMLCINKIKTFVYFAFLLIFLLFIIFWTSDYTVPTEGIILITV
jgi:hypothetical protein